MSKVQGARAQGRVRAMRPSDFIDRSGRRGIPANDRFGRPGRGNLLPPRETFRQAPRPQFGRAIKPPKTPLRLPIPGLAAGFALAGAIDAGIEWYTSQKPAMIGGPWTYCKPCNPHPTDYTSGKASGSFARSSCAATDCLSGQGLSSFPYAGWAPAPVDLPSNRNTWIWSDLSPTRAHYRHIWRRNFTSAPEGVYPRYIPNPVLPMYGPWTAPDPNRARNAQNDPQPFERPQDELQNVVERDGWTNIGAKPRAENRPPRGGEKEKKVRNIGARLFNSLDFLSEMGDIIDAVYEALPKKIRKEAEKGWRKEQAFIDSGGQYGIDRADEKLVVLYNNWDKLDAVQAWKNIAANSLEDELHGQLHKRLPNYVGGAMDASFKGFGKVVNNFVDTLK